MVDTTAMVFAGAITPAETYGYYPSSRALRGWWRPGVDAATAVKNAVPGRTPLVIAGGGTPSISGAYMTLKAGTGGSESYLETGYTDAPNCSGGVLVRGDTGADTAHQPIFMANYDGNTGTAQGPGIYLYQNAAQRVTLRVYYTTAVSNLYYASVAMTIDATALMALFWWVRNDPVNGQIGLVDMITGTQVTLAETRTRVAHTQTVKLGNKANPGSTGPCDMYAAYLSHETGSAELRAAQWKQMKAQAVARGVTFS